jgi:hypothetical protein
VNSFLRFIILLSITVWLGGIIFFSFVVAPNVFGVLLSRNGGQQLAGQIVSPSLSALHIMGLVCGAVFLASALALRKRAFGVASALIVAMISLTAASQFVVTPRLAHIRRAANSGDIQLTQGPEFDKLHTLSVGLEGVTLLCGLSALWFVAREPRE